MLTYLQEQNRTLEPNESSSQDQSQPLSGPGDYLTVAGHGKKLRQSTMVLCVLFAVGALGVFFMIKKAAPVTANAATNNEDQAQIDRALAQIENMKKEMDNQMSTVVGRFYDFSTVRQIGVDELKKNPFRRELDLGSVALESDMGGFASQQKERMAAEAQSRAGSMELWSITSTPKGMCCMIGEKVLYEGDSIGEMKVKSIYPKRVVLDYKGIPVELTIE